MFASIVSKHPRNLGEWILDEMNHFRFHSNITSTIPFPNLVSYILFFHNVWHLTSEDKVVKPQRFGKTHLTRMQISFTEASSQSKIKKKSVASSPRAEEAQSSQAGSPSASTPAPSFFGPSIQPWIKDAVQGAVQTILESNNSLLLTFDAKMKVLVAHMNENFNRLFDLQEAHTAKLQHIESFLHTFGFSPPEPPPSTSDPIPSAPVDPSPSPEPTPVAPPPVTPSSDPAPSSSSQAPLPSPTPPLPIPQDPLPSPPPTLTISSDSTQHPAPTLKPTTSSSTSSSTASAPPPPFDPSSAIVVYTPPPSSDITFPTFLPDDKGGEN